MADQDIPTCGRNAASVSLHRARATCSFRAAIFRDRLFDKAAATASSAVSRIGISWPDACEMIKTSVIIGGIRFRPVQNTAVIISNFLAKLFLDDEVNRDFGHGDGGNGEVRAVNVYICHM